MNERINDFSDYIYREEKKLGDVGEVSADTKAFCVYAGGESVTKKSGAAHSEQGSTFSACRAFFGSTSELLLMLHLRTKVAKQRTKISKWRCSVERKCSI